MFVLLFSVETISDKINENFTGPVGSIPLLPVLEKSRGVRHVRGLFTGHSVHSIGVGMIFGMGIFSGNVAQTIRRI